MALYLLVAYLHHACPWGCASLSQRWRSAPAPAGGPGAPSGEQLHAGHVALYRRGDRSAGLKCGPGSTCAWEHGCSFIGRVDRRRRCRRRWRRRGVHARGHPGSAGGGPEVQQRQEIFRGQRRAERPRPVAGGGGGAWCGRTGGFLWYGKPASAAGTTARRQCYWRRPACKPSRAAARRARGMPRPRPVLSMHAAGA